MEREEGCQERNYRDAEEEEEVQGEERPVAPPDQAEYPVVGAPPGSDDEETDEVADELRPLLPELVVERGGGVRRREERNLEGEDEKGERECENPVREPEEAREISAPEERNLFLRIAGFRDGDPSRKSRSGKKWRCRRSSGRPGQFHAAGYTGLQPRVLRSFMIFPAIFSAPSIAFLSFSTSPSW